MTQPTFLKQYGYYIALIIGWVLVLFGVLRKILHYPGADDLLVVGMIGVLLYTVIGLYEIFSSPRLPLREKTLWLLGFLFVNGVTALVYAILRRQVLDRGFSGA